MVIPGDVQLWDRSATGATRKKRDPLFTPDWIGYRVRRRRARHQDRHLDRSPSRAEAPGATGPIPDTVTRIYRNSRLSQSHYDWRNGGTVRTAV